MDWTAGMIASAGTWVFGILAQEDESGEAHGSYIFCLSNVAAAIKTQWIDVETQYTTKVTFPMFHAYKVHLENHLPVK